MNKYGLLMLAGDVVVGVIVFALLRGYRVSPGWAAALAVVFVSLVNVAAAFLTAEEYEGEM